MRFGSAWAAADFEVIDKTTEIAPNIDLIALVTDRPGTLELREPSLALDTFAALKKAFGARYLYAGLGSEIAIGPEIRSKITAAGISRE